MHKNPKSGRRPVFRVVLWVLALLTSSTFVFLGLYSFHQGTASSKPVVLPYEIFWCGEDAHCVVVDQIGCCSCEQGGAQAAINSSKRDELRRFLKSACRPRETQVCVQMDLCRDDFEAVCVDRRCKLEPTGN
jgi:hypothetical protein